MPCWTRSAITVDLDATGMNRERLSQAANAHGVYVSVVDGRVTLSSYSLSGEEMVRVVKQEYASLTVQAGLKKFGLVVKGKTEIAATKTVKLTVGRR